ncbi:type II secretion system protein [Parashewanella spongiae]|uniref:Type II secretion system protein n=1 Tax=Parashewanella spongiae TaxID=342950 RepID=A0A3A6UCL2_9GAMM|nr:type II secretion system protein [Parashewanella spongiae]MCL1078249.1 type II secretion system GspH family protein [Parashewanella spongiae]RJY15103.1 type II secretion system protein [Parashewanella spongiae]
MVSYHCQSDQQGFTLVELITVIMILGIVLIGVSGFITFGTRIFVDSSSVDQALSDSRFALQRMTRELRTAMPNSLRVTSGVGYQCIEFVPIVTASSYVILPFQDKPSNGTGRILADDNPTRVKADHRAYVYPLTPEEVYQAPSIVTKHGIVTGVTQNDSEINLTFATVGSQNIQFSEASAQKRIYFTHTPVSYCFSSVTQTLRRYKEYGFYALQPDPVQMGDGALLAGNIVNQQIGNDYPITLTPSTLVNNALIHLQPRFTVNGETIQYQHQVQVINVP